MKRSVSYYQDEIKKWESEGYLNNGFHVFDGLMQSWYISNGSRRLLMIRKDGNFNGVEILFKYE